jgi:hypothetical protein
MRCGRYFKQVAVRELSAPLIVMSTAADLIGKKVLELGVAITELDDSDSCMH